MLTAEDAYALNAARERYQVSRKPAATRSRERQHEIEILLDELFGMKDEHEQVARELVAYYDATDFGANTRSVIVLLRRLARSKKEGLL